MSVASVVTRSALVYCDDPSTAPIEARLPVWSFCRLAKLLRDPPLPSICPSGSRRNASDT